MTKTVDIEAAVRLDRVHIDDPHAPISLASTLRTLLLPHRCSGLVIICIGTDRSTGDCLGPLIGSKLRNNPLMRCRIVGCLDEPVHATNLAEIASKMEKDHAGARILAIDACLGRSDSVGYINVCNGPLRPGTGVNKNLPSIGHCHVTGVVNVGGFMEYMVLQNTRLNIVMRMADAITDGIVYALSDTAQ